MLIRIRRANLCRALRRVKDLGLCRVETVGTDRIGISATDGIRSFRGLVPADVLGTGVLVVSAAIVLQVLDALHVESVDIVRQSDYLKISDICSLVLMPEAAVGVIPTCSTHAIATPLEQVKLAMEQVAHAATTDIVSPLCGIEWRDGAIVAGSSAAIALCKVAIPIDRAIAVPPGIAQHLPDAAAIAVDSDRIFWRDGESETSLRLPPHRFPSRLVDHVLSELSRPHWTQIGIHGHFLSEVREVGAAIEATEAELAVEPGSMRARVSSARGSAEIKIPVESMLRGEVRIPIRHLVGPVDSIWLGGRGVFLTGASYTCYISALCTH